DARTERTLDGREDDRLIHARGLRRIIGLGLIEQRDETEIQLSLAQGFKRLAIEAQLHRCPEGVDWIREQQHLNAASARGLELGARFEALSRVADEIINRRLVRLEVADVFFQRPHAFALGREKAAKREQLIAALEILIKPLFDDAAECLPNFAEAVRI